MLQQELLQEAKKDIRLYGLIGAGLLNGIAAVAQAYCLATIVDGAFLRGQTTSEVGPWLAALVFASLVRAGLVWGTEVLGASLACGIRAGLRCRLLTKLFSAGPVAITAERTGEMLSTLGEGVDGLEPYFSRYLPQLVTACLVPLCVLAAVAPQDVAAAALLLVTAPLIPLLLLLIGEWAQRLSRRRWDTLGRLSAKFYDVLQGLVTLKLLGRSQEQVTALFRASEEFRTTTLGVLRVAFLSALVLELMTTISTALVAVMVGLKVLYGTLAFRPALFVLLLAPEFYLPLRLLGTHFHAGLTAKVAAERIFALLREDSGPAACFGQDSLAAGEAVATVRFSQVNASYSGRTVPAVADLSFTVSAGQMLALVGPSGAGKTTVANLLLGFLPPDSGEIIVNGRPLPTLDRQAWLAKVAYIAQMPYLFSGTITENIAMGLPVEADKVRQAAEAAAADDFIGRLPGGYDTLVGEDGARLSGGEIQRIAIARAFYRQASLVIVDEATSWLDPLNESLVRAAISRLRRGRIVLLIAHRLSSTAEADQVLVMDGGRMVDYGTHQELSSREGVYRRLVLAYRGEV